MTRASMARRWGSQPRRRWRVGGNWAGPTSGRTGLGASTSRASLTITTIDPLARLQRAMARRGPTRLVCSPPLAYPNDGGCNHQTPNCWGPGSVRPEVAGVVVGAHDPAVL